MGGSEDVEVGQVWASSHTQDRRHGWRQRRIVTDVEERYAYLQTEGQDFSSRVLLIRRSDGSVFPRAHRLVALSEHLGSPATGAEPARSNPDRRGV